MRVSSRRYVSEEEFEALVKRLFPGVSAKALKACYEIENNNVKITKRDESTVASKVVGS